tara:strand:+ start:681 stop:1436 length:756 start_codon:yes stop_codon:yes gene_type:complete
LDIKEFLNFKAEEYNNVSFIKDDPIQIPHFFKKKEDIEISSFLTSTISWGNRKSIITSSIKMMKLMDNDPYNFIINHSEKDLKNLLNFVHRTFNGYDFMQFIISLRHIYKNYGGLENIFAQNIKNQSMHNSIHEFKKIFFEVPYTERTKKHVSDPFKGSASKRINMFLRWMVRKDNKGVDFGIWESIDQKYLSCPLDVHSGNVARKLGLINRKQNDHKTVLELDSILRVFDKNDPVKYDFALFGIGVFEKY